MARDGLRATAVVAAVLVVAGFAGGGCRAEERSFGVQGTLAPSPTATPRVARAPTAVSTAVPTPVAVLTPTVVPTPAAALAESPSPAGTAGAEDSTSATAATEADCADGDPTPATVVGGDRLAPAEPDPDPGAETGAGDPPGTRVQAWPATLRLADDGTWLVTALIDEQCGEVPAVRLVDDRGGLDRHLQGLELEFPASGTWIYEFRPPPESRPGPPYFSNVWRLDGGGPTAIGVHVWPGRRIDGQLERATVDLEIELGESPAEDWYGQPIVEGADRAVDMTYPGGVVAGTIADRMIEVEDWTIVVDGRIYVADAEVVPRDEVERFIQSTRIDRAEFLADRD